MLNPDLTGKNVAICVTGGIACYKICTLVSLLKKHGAEVYVAMTENAAKFVSPLTFEALSHNAVVTDSFSRQTPYEVEHIAFAKRAVNTKSSAIPCAALPIMFAVAGATTITSARLANAICSIS